MTTAFISRILGGAPYWWKATIAVRTRRFSTGLVILLMACAVPTRAAAETVHGIVTFVGTLGDYVQRPAGPTFARFRFRLSESSCGTPPKGVADRWFHVTGRMDAPSFGNAYRTLLTGLLARSVTVVQVDGVPNCDAAQLQTLAIESSQIALYPSELRAQTVLD